MKQVNYNEKLQKEKEKLNRLMDDALKNGVPIIQDKGVIMQNLKVDALIVRIQKEKKTTKKLAGTISKQPDGASL